ncbi:type IV-A pilus assembly ATPase PilB [Motiliproteus coralliicola]|uniref:Type IV-A pilus assembly ATPase PilB n=1 Tax=Motiliproteus coralliicola TaxID=2283196 RepID=A0A369WQG8_9GAMM|nr:type IV-A pilus assembly ATPase PilB [Motiliproteus coralliicola]RDE22806.1 type IV-A pilus assembly ATPase PilB [Motiliproteus coralliicola]
MGVQPIQPLTGLARRLVNDSILSSENATQALNAANQQNISFISYAVQERLVSAYKAATAAADEFGAPLLDLDQFDISSIPQDLVPEELIRKHQALPLIKRDNRIYVAVADPTNIQGLDQIKFSTGIKTEAIVVEEDKLTEFIDQFMEQHSSTELDGLDDADLENLELDEIKEHGVDEGDDTDDGAGDAPIVRFVNKILLDAIKSGSSDIHFEPYEKSYRIRFRTDGILREVAKPPVNLTPRLAARLKVMSQMDISERRIPQDGRIKMKISKTKSIDFRVNTLPTLWGEKIVLRILDASSAQMGIDALGYEPEQKDRYLKTLEQPQGMILVTGPTGSGKTVSLYTGLNILNTDERNISTAEDPVEINLEGINQVHVNPKVGLTFASALRSFLRQDPDVVMVGEIRDLETAEIAIKAAQTGHMVLSTLHTNSAPETLTRLRNMGVPAFNIATSVSLVIAQRLGRRLCSSCKQPVEIPEPALREEGFSQSQIDAGITVYSPVGCNSCVGGYKGRVGIYEVMPMTSEISALIMNDGNSLEIAELAASQGTNNLRASGLLKVIQGVTSLEEVNRVTKV